jgi:hypothetical protein
MTNEERQARERACSLSFLELLLAVKEKEAKL